MAAGPLARLSASLKRLPRRLVEVSAEAFDDIAKTRAGRAVGSGGRMHRRNHGVVETVELGTELTVSGGTDSDVAYGVVVAEPAGPWVWLEYGTKEHWIGAPGQLLGERLDHPVYGPVLHPGIIGRRVWSESIRQFEGEVDSTVDREIRRIA